MDHTIPKNYYSQPWTVWFSLAKEAYNISKLEEIIWNQRLRKHISSLDQM